MTTHLLIDANALCHRAKHAMDTVNLSTHEIKTEVIFGFIMGLPMLSKALNSGNFIFVWDSPRYLRNNIYPGYKDKPTEVKSDSEKELDALTYPQFDMLRETIIPDMGFNNNFWQKGMEADDVIAAITINNPDKEFIIVSRDNDLYQLLNGKVVMYDPILKKLNTDLSFEAKHGIPPQRWWEAKAIAGCSTDSLPGVPGVGEPTAIKYMLGTLPPKYKTYKSIMDNEDIIERNKLLVKLPFEGTDIPNLVPDELVMGRFIGVFEDFDFQSQLRDDAFDRWMGIIERYDNE